MKDVRDGGVLDVGELDAEAHYDAQNQQRDEEFEHTPRVHRSAVLAVEDQNKQNIHYGDGAACHQGNFAVREHGYGDRGADYFGHVGGDDGAFAEGVAEVVEPAGAVRAGHLGEVHAGYGAEVDAEGLQEDGEDVGEQDHEEEFESVACAGCDVCGIVSGVDVGLYVSVNA